jgi:hypothetical protein
MIGVGAVVAVVAGKVDVVNAGNEFTKSQGPLLGIAFHVLHRKTALTSWGVHPIGEFGSRRNITSINMTKTSIRLSTLIFSCVAAFALASLVGCACDEKHSSDSSATTMSTDSKDMTHRGDQNSH